MSGSREDGARFWNRLAELCDDVAVPLEDLLQRLSAVWNELVPNASVCVVALDGEMLVSRITGSSPRRLPLTGPDSWEAVALADAEATGRFGVHRALAFRWPGRTLRGGVILGDGCDDVPAAKLECLCVLSGRLLAATSRDGAAGDALADAATPRLNAAPGMSTQVPVDHDRLESLAQFAAGAGHEINNPLGTIIGRAQALLRDETDPDRQHALSTIGGQAYRIRDMIGDVMLFARPPEPEPTSVLLEDALADVLAGETELIRSTRLGVEEEVTPGMVCHADPVQLRVALSALLRNAIEAIEGDDPPRLRIWAAPGRIGECSGALIRFADNGRGMNDEERRHLFDPFYSGRQAGRGLGFGLSKCWRIVSNHGGLIGVQVEDGWTTFEVLWPQHAP